MMKWLNFSMLVLCGLSLIALFPETARGESQGQILGELKNLVVPLAQCKDAKTCGEDKKNGTVAVKGGDASVQATVDKVNKLRLKLYKMRWKKEFSRGANKVTFEQYKLSMGEGFVAKDKGKGRIYRNESGSWVPVN